MSEDFELVLPADWTPIRDAEGRVIGGRSDKAIDLSYLFPEPQWRRSRWAYRWARFRFAMRLGNAWPHRVGVAFGLRYSPSVSAALGALPPRSRRRA